MPDVLQKMVDGVVVDLTAEEIEAFNASNAAADLDFGHERSMRNSRLSASDWTQTIDAPLTAEKQAEWATYRQELRDYPAQAEKVSELPEWPTPPE